MISALVINLEKSVDRLEFQKNQLTKLGISMQRLSAIECEDISEKDYELQANGWERKMRPAEVACFLSHKAVWQYVYESNKPWLIMEDDALLAKSVPAILQAIEDNNLKVDYINFETRNRHKWLSRRSIDLVNDYQMRKLFQDRNGSAAYLLFPTGAKKLLSRAHHSMPALADAFISSTYELNAWQVYPAAAIQLDQCTTYNLPLKNFFHSTISTNPIKPESNKCMDYWTFKFRRVFAQFRMGIRQLSVFSHSIRIKVPIIKGEFDSDIEIYEKCKGL